MKNIPLEKITEKMEALAPELDEFLSSSSTASILSSVCSRYTLSSEEKFWVSRALGLYILRLYTAQDFVNELARVTPEKYLNQFRQELEDKLFQEFSKLFPHSVIHTFDVARDITNSSGQSETSLSITTICTGIGFFFSSYAFPEI